MILLVANVVFKPKDVVFVASINRDSNMSSVKQTPEQNRVMERFLFGTSVLNIAFFLKKKN